MITSSKSYTTRSLSNFNIADRLQLPNQNVNPDIRKTDTFALAFYENHQVSIVGQMLGFFNIGKFILGAFESSRQELLKESKQ